MPIIPSILFCKQPPCTYQEESASMYGQGPIFLPNHPPLASGEERNLHKSSLLVNEVTTALGETSSVAIVLQSRLQPSGSGRGRTSLSTTLTGTAALHRPHLPSAVAAAWRQRQDNATADRELRRPGRRRVVRGRPAKGWVALPMSLRG